MSKSSFPAFDPTLANPGRDSAWNVAEEVVRLADAGSNGLAGVILRDGYSPLSADRVSVVPADQDQLPALCAAILAALDSRKGDKGGVLKVINGSTVDFIRTRFDSLLQESHSVATVVDGRRRTLASLIAYGCGRDLEVPTVEADAVAEVAFRENYNRSLAQSLSPWAKVEAGERTIAEKPSITEAELMTALGVKRGDGQLIFRAASAIGKHGLTPNRKLRCPGKEEWKAILDSEKRADAKAMLDKVQTSVRAKSIGIDVVTEALSKLPEGTILDARELSTAMADREAFDAYLVKVAASK